MIFRKTRRRTKIFYFCLQQHKSFRREFSQLIWQVTAIVSKHSSLSTVLVRVILTLTLQVTHQGKGKEGEVRKQTAPPATEWLLELEEIHSHCQPMPGESCSKKNKTKLHLPVTSATIPVFLMERTGHEGFINSFTDANPRSISQSPFNHFLRTFSTTSINPLLSSNLPSISDTLPDGYQWHHQSAHYQQWWANRQVPDHHHFTLLKFAANCLHSKTVIFPSPQLQQNSIQS